MSDRMIHSYASRTWSQILADLLKDKPHSIVSPDIVNPPSVSFGARCDGPMLVSLTIPEAQRLLKRLNGSRGYLVTRLSRLDSDNFDQITSVRAFDPEGNLLAVIDHDGQKFGISG